jgi:hypothetical protein
MIQCNFVAGGIIISLGARKPTYLPGVYNTAKIGYGFLYAWGMWTIVSITIALFGNWKLKALKQRGNNPSSACKANYNENGKKRVINLYIQKEVV